MRAVNCGPAVWRSTVRQASTPLRRNPSLAPAGDAKANEHGAPRRKLGARALAAGGESRRFGGALSGRIWRSFKKGALPAEREAEAAEARSEGGGGS